MRTFVTLIDPRLSFMLMVREANAAEIQLEEVAAILQEPVDVSDGFDNPKGIEYIGGLLGVSLTVQNAGSPKAGDRLLVICYDEDRGTILRYHYLFSITKDYA